MIKNTLIVKITLRWAFGRFYSHIGNPNWAVRRKPKVLPRIESQQLLSNTSVKLDDCHIILLCLKGSKSYEFNQTILNWESDSVVNPEDFAASLCASCGPGNLFAQDISSEQNPFQILTNTTHCAKLYVSILHSEYDDSECIWLETFCRCGKNQATLFIFWLIIHCSIYFWHSY